MVHGVVYDPLNREDGPSRLNAEQEVLDQTQGRISIVVPSVPRSRPSSGKSAVSMHDIYPKEEQSWSSEEEDESEEDDEEEEDLQDSFRESQMTLESSIGTADKSDSRGRSAVFGEKEFNAMMSQGDLSAF